MFLVRLALMLCVFATCGLVLPGSQALAAGEPEAPITEACGGPVLPGALRLCGTLNPHADAKTGYYFAYRQGGSCTGGSKTPAGEEVEGQNVEVSGEVAGLEPGTEYTYCLVATNPSGETFGQALTYTPALIPQTPSTDTVLSEGTNDTVALLATPVTVTPIMKVSTKPLTRAEKLAKALKTCRIKDRSKAKRAQCKATARKQYGADKKR